MIPATVVYATAAVFSCLITLRWALFDGAPVLLAFSCAVLIGLFWPAACFIYLKSEVP